MVRISRKHAAELPLALLIATALCFVLPTASLANDDPSPQYTNISPLPGGGVAIAPDGSPDGAGAFQINIPVAYTPGWGYAQLAGYVGNYHNGRDQEFGNGSGIFALGFFGKPRVYMSGMQVSRHWEEAKVLSGQAQLMQETGKGPALALGMQDMLMKEEDGRSVYGVATKSITLADRPMFASLGYGAGRFKDRPFGGLSAPIGESLNAALEWDGFQINMGLGWRPGGRRGAVTFLGALNGRSGWLLGVSVAGVLGPR